MLIQVYLHMGQMEKSLRLIQPSDLVSVHDRRDMRFTPAPNRKREEGSSPFVLVVPYFAKIPFICFSAVSKALSDVVCPNNTVETPVLPPDRKRLLPNLLQQKSQQHKTKQHKTQIAVNYLCSDRVLQWFVANQIECISLYIRDE